LVSANGPSLTSSSEQPVAVQQHAAAFHLGDPVLDRGPAVALPGLAVTLGGLVDAVDEHVFHEWPPWFIISTTNAAAGNGRRS
jgi:hypothetical protein